MKGPYEESAIKIALSKELHDMDAMIMIV
jgi:hypothetical protein